MTQTVLTEHTGSPVIGESYCRS